MPDTTIDTTPARELWQRLAPSNAKRLIDARDAKKRDDDRRKKELAALALLYWFDADRMRYIRADGRVASPPAIKQAVNTFAEKVQNQLGATTTRLIDDQVGLEEYRAAMTQQVTVAHTAGYAIGVGGAAELERYVPGVSRVLTFQMEKLNDFIRDAGRGGISPEALVARARLYGSSVSPSYEAGANDGLMRLADSGVTIEVRNILGQAEHCMTRGLIVGCLDETERGWVKLGELSLPGHRTCKSGCKCRIDHRIVQESKDNG